MGDFSQLDEAAAFHIGYGMLARNTLLNLVGRVAPLLVGVVTLPYVIHHLGADRFGLLALVWIVVGYFALFDLGIGPATTKFVAELLGKGETGKLPELVWTAFFSQACLGLGAGVLLAAASPLLIDHLLNVPGRLHPEARWIFLIIAAFMPLDFASGSLEGLLAASQRFDLLNALGIPFSALNYLLPVVVLALGFGLPAIVLALLLSRMVVVVALLWLCLRLYPTLRTRPRYNSRLVRSLLGYGGWITVSGAVRPVLFYLDRFIIGSVLSIAAVGFYTPPFMIANKLTILPSSLTNALFPAFSTSAGRGDDAWIRSTLIRSLKFLLLLLGPAALVLAFFARPLLTVWLGPKFASEGTLVLQILALALFIDSLGCVPSNLLSGAGRPDIPAKFHLFELPLYVGLVWYLTIRFGLPGAALACAIRVSLDTLLLVVRACRFTHTSMRLLISRDLRRSAVTLLAFAAGLSVLWCSTHAFIADAVLTLFLSGGFLLASWHYVLDLEEKFSIRTWLRLAR